MRSESLSAFLGYMPSQRDRCPLQRRLLTGGSRTVDMKPAENPKCESIILRPIIKCAILTRHCNIFDALKFEIVRNTRLLKRKCGHSRKQPLCDSRCGVEGHFFFSPSLLFGWCPSFFPNPNLPPRDLESCAEDCKRRRGYHTDS